MLLFNAADAVPAAADVVAPKFVPRATEAWLASLRACVKECDGAMRLLLLTPPGAKAVETIGETAGIGVLPPPESAAGSRRCCRFIAVKVDPSLAAPAFEGYLLRSARGGDVPRLSIRLGVS